MVTTLLNIFLIGREFWEIYNFLLIFFYACIIFKKKKKNQRLTATLSIKYLNFKSF